MRIIESEQKNIEYIFNIGQLADIADWNEVVEYTIEQHLKDTENSVLTSFDDSHQASYTSMHASMNDELYCDSEIDPETKEYYLECFEYRLKVLRTFNNSENCELFEKIALTPNELMILTKINHNPFLACDANIEINKVPVKKSQELLAAFPNGYFSCDLDPFENFKLAEILDEQFGYRLMSIGASFLAFARPTHLQTNEINLLQDFLAKLYQIENLSNLNDLMEKIAKNKYLILSYVESIEDMYEDLLS